MSVASDVTLIASLHEPVTVMRTGKASNKSVITFVLVFF